MYIKENNKANIILIDNTIGVLQDPAHSCCFNQDGSIAVIGMETGRWAAIETLSHTIICEHTDGNEQIECCLFSPGNYVNIDRMRFQFKHILFENGL